MLDFGGDWLSNEPDWWFEEYTTDEHRPQSRVYFTNDKYKCYNCDGNGFVVVRDAYGWLKSVTCVCQTKPE